MKIRNLLFILFTLLLSMEAGAKVFEKAKWIGTDESHLPFNSNFLSVFVIEFDLDLNADGKAVFLYGIDDPRLLNSAYNIYNLKNKSDSSYIALEFDGLKEVKIYRVGYHSADNKAKPFQIVENPQLIKGKNKIEIRSNCGMTDLIINGKKFSAFNLNPIGTGGDYISFPVLAQMAVDISTPGKSEISNIRIKNYREPGNVIYNIPKNYNRSSKIELPIVSFPELKTNFNVKDKIFKAGIKSTARGIYDIYINDCLVSQNYFHPGLTAYNKTHLYEEFDILPFIKNGENEIKVQLAEGWWSGSATYTPENWNYFGDRPSFIAEIELAYNIGKTETILTSPEEWIYSVDGPIQSGSFFMGETYDASKTEKNKEWYPAQEIILEGTVNNSIGDWENINLRPSFGDSVAVIDTITAKKLLEPRDGIYIYDMGQNFAGVPYIELSNLSPGQKVNLRFAEVLYPDMQQYYPNIGMVMTENLRGALSFDQYIAKGEGKEVFSPRYTLHGYRYLELSGINQPLPLENVKSLALSSIKKINAHYECSDTLVNRLWQNIIWSALSNFISIPTDCPQRNERLGWMGDISVFSPTAFKIADISPLIRQFLTSIRDVQAANGKFLDIAPVGQGFGGLLWGSAGIVVPYEYYKASGDIETISEHYPAMKRYMEYLSKETIDPANNIIVQNREWGDLGDWLSPEYEQNDKSLLWECYYIYDLTLMKEMAILLGNEQDAEHYEKLRNERIDFFRHTYIDPTSEETIWSEFNPEKKGLPINTQASYALPISMGVYSSPKFIDNFLKTISTEKRADNGDLCPPFSLMTGFIGTAWISEALSKTDNSEMAYKLLTMKDFPSWLYPVSQGATTIWERLDSYTHEKGFGNNNSMNSFNHYSFGSVGNWLLTRSLGINVDNNGEIIISPQPDSSESLTYAKGWQETPFGKIESEWSVNNDNVNFEITIPENRTATFIYKENKIPLTSGNNSLSFQR